MGSTDAFYRHNATNTHRSIRENIFCAQQFDCLRPCSLKDFCTSHYTKLKTKKNFNPKCSIQQQYQQKIWIHRVVCGSVFWRHPTYTSNIKHTIYGLRMKMLLSHWKSSTTPSSYGTVVCSVRPLLRMFAIHYPRMIIYTAVLFVWFVVFLRVFLLFSFVIIFISNMLSLLTH